MGLCMFVMVSLCSALCKCTYMNIYLSENPTMRRSTCLQEAAMHTLALGATLAHGLFGFAVSDRINLDQDSPYLTTLAGAGRR